MRFEDKPQRVLRAKALWKRKDDSGPHDLVLGLRYCDDVARFDDRWLITARTAKPQWARGAFPTPPDELRSDWHDVDIHHV